MTEHLHYVTITGTEDRPEIKFVCHGDSTAQCHQYPGDDCTCETWTDDGGGADQYGHKFIPHDECWMKDWFDNDGTDPSAEDPITLADCGYRPGMSGPIKTESYVPDYVEWWFIEGASR